MGDLAMACPAAVAGFVPLRWLGVFLIAAGLPVLLDSFVRFAVQGMGTPAPVAPPQHLVVSGLYRYVRNPMYVAVVAMVLGQGLFFGNIRVLEYGLAVWLAMHLFVVFYEEPTLLGKFGAEYEEYCRNVRRWWPRVGRGGKEAVSKWQWAISENWPLSELRR